MPFVTVASVHQKDALISTSGSGISQKDWKAPSHSFGQKLFLVRDNRRRASKSPEKEDIRPDSGKITDISENSTTDDYATAYENSGTDTSSKRSTNYKQPDILPDVKEGSSFETTSVGRSFVTEDTVQVVPSPPLKISEEKAVDTVKPVESQKDNTENKRERDVEMTVCEKEEASVDLESSSSGSYSLDSEQRESKSEWTEQDKKRMKKEFKLDLTDPSNVLENWCEDKAKTEDISPKFQEQIKTKFTPVLNKRVQQVKSIQSKFFLVDINQNGWKKKTNCFFFRFLQLKNGIPKPVEK